MIAISTKSRYALLAMCELVRRGTSKPVPISDIAESREIPVQFLEQLFSTLRRAGMLKSQRGVKGGYSFAKMADEITVLEIVEALDGKVGAGVSGAGEPFEKCAESIREVLSSYTISDAAAAESNSGKQMYYI